MSDEKNSDIKQAWTISLLALALNKSGMSVRDDWMRAAEAVYRTEEEREAFRHYSEDCPSLDEHQDGNAYERLCTDPRHPYHRDSRPQCDRDLCPYLHPQGHPFMWCCACRASGEDSPRPQRWFGTDDTKEP